MNTTGITPATDDTKRGMFLKVFESCIFVLFDVLASCGNILVIAVVYKNVSLRTVTNMFIVSLALTDFLMALLISSTRTVVSIADKRVFGDLGCQIHYSVAYSLGGISLLNLELLAVNRYFKVVKPSFYSKLFTKKKTLLMIIGTWLFTISGGTAFYKIAKMNFIPFPQNPTLCFLIYSSRSIVTASLVVFGFYVLFSSLVIFVCYAAVFCKVTKHSRAVAPSLGLSAANSVNDVKMTKLMTAMLVGFYLCWIPVFITQTLQKFIEITDETQIYYNFYFTFPAYASSVINPIIYTVMSRQFRREFLNMLRSWCSVFWRPSQSFSRRRQTRVKATRVSVLPRRQSEDQVKKP